MSFEATLIWVIIITFSMIIQRYINWQNFTIFLRYTAYLKKYESVIFFMTKHTSCTVVHEKNANWFFIGSFLESKSRDQNWS